MEKSTDTFHPTFNIFKMYYWWFVLNFLTLRDGKTKGSADFRVQ